MNTFDFYTKIACKITCYEIQETKETRRKCHYITFRHFNCKKPYKLKQLLQKIHYRMRTSENTYENIDNNLCEKADVFRNLFLEFIFKNKEM